MALLNIPTKITELMQAIEALTNNIEESISNHFIDTIDALLAQRQLLILELAAAHSSESEIITIRDFFARIHSRDQPIMQSLKDQSDAMKTSLLKFNKVKHYVL